MQNFKNKLSLLTKINYTIAKFAKKVCIRQLSESMTFVADFELLLTLKNEENTPKF